MRAVIFILIVGVLVLIAGIATGFLNINQTRPAAVPQVSSNGKGVTATGGQTPTFEVQTGSVKIGAKPATVKVPSLQVQAPQNQTPPQPTANAQ